MSVKSLPVKDVIVVRSSTDMVDEESFDEHFGRLARETGSLVVVLGDGQTLEMLDEEAMGQAGWRKMTRPERDAIQHPVPC